MLRKISTWLNNPSEQHTHQFKRCDYDQCQDEGTYQAPRERQAVTQPHDLSQWYFFCLHHVREYNQQWRYYEGMTEQQAQQSYQNDLMWNRPSWPFGHAPRMQYNPNFLDPFTFFSHQSHNPYLGQLTIDEQHALYLFGLNIPFTSDQLQASYRQQVKNNHPDLHQNEDSEEKIRIINQSYSLLKKVLEHDKC